LQVRARARLHEKLGVAASRPGRVTPPSDVPGSRKPAGGGAAARAAGGAPPVPVASRAAYLLKRSHPPPQPTDRPTDRPPPAQPALYNCPTDRIRAPDDTILVSCCDCAVHHRGPARVARPPPPPTQPTQPPSVTYA